MIQYSAKTFPYLVRMAFFSPSRFPFQLDFLKVTSYAKYSSQ